MQNIVRRCSGLLAGLLFMAVVATAPVFAADLQSAAATPDVATSPPAVAGPTVGDLKVMADTVWVLITGMLVFFMNLGFACVESGMCREKNCVNILSKNFIVFAVTSIGFWLLGWGMMFGDGSDYHRHAGTLDGQRCRQQSGHVWMLTRVTTAH